MAKIHGYVSQIDQTGPDLATTVSKSGDKVFLDVKSASGSSIISEPWDSVEVTARTADGCPTTVVYSNNSVPIATVTITYDVSGNLESVVRS